MRKEMLYGGWLKFFRIINAINWVACTIVVVLVPIFLIVMIFLDQLDQDQIDIAAAIVECIPGAIFSYLIWKIILVQSEGVPNKVVWLMRLALAFHLLIYAGLTLAYSQEFISDKPTPFVISLVYYFIWSSYFKKSKRVLAYYGANYTKTHNQQLKEKDAASGAL